jgi:CIC family chloride channel protein
MKIAAATEAFLERLVSSPAGRYSSVILIAALIGFLAGCANIAFRFCQEFMYEAYFLSLYQTLQYHGGYYKLLIPFLPVIGILFLIPFAWKYGHQEVLGYGFARFLETVNIKGGVIKARTIYLKTIGPAFTIGTGGSAGIEGPIAQIGGAIGSNVGRLFRLSGERIKLYIASGTAGAVAATFNAPITGVMFALEIVLLGAYEMSSFVAIVVSAGVATMVSRAHYGENPAFIVPQYEFSHSVELIFYVFLGVALGLLAVLYIRFFHFTKERFTKLELSVYVKPLIGAFLVGLIGMKYRHVMGNGYEFITDSLSGNMIFKVMLPLVFFKIIATSLTLGSGGAGGVFAPSLFIGSMAGGSFGCLIQKIYPLAEPGAYATVGVGAFLAAVTHAPLTGIFLLFEMTGNYKIIIPVMIASIIGMTVSRLINRDSIDTVELTKKGIDVHGGKESAILNSIYVKDIMDKNFQTIHQSKNLDDLAELIIKGNNFYFPVIDDNGKMTGIISLQDVKSALFEEDLREFVKVGYAASKKVITLNENDTLNKAYSLSLLKDIKEIPVVADSDKNLVIGMLKKDRIMDAYQKALLKRRVEE